MQKHSSNLVREWARLGVDLDVYFTGLPGYPAVSELHRTLVPEDATGQVRFFASAPSWLPYFPFHHYADCYVESCRMAEQVLRESAESDFIYAQGFTGWELLRIKRRGGLQLPPVGVNLHGMESLQEFNGGPREALLRRLGRPIERWLLRRADVALSLGGELDQLIRRVAPGTPVVSSGNGIQREWLCEQVEPHEGLRRFIFLGRYTRRKGLHVLYQALRNLPPDAEFEFHFVGDIAESDRPKDARFIYHQAIVSETALRSLLRRMDVLVCPSLAEGVPTVVLEGMASALAVIATDVGATSLLVDASAGYLVRAGDAGALTKALLEVLALDGRALRCLRHRGLEKARAHEWSRIAGETLAGIRAVANSASALRERRPQLLPVSW